MGQDMHDTISSALETIKRIAANDFATLDNDDLHDALVRLDLARDRAEEVMLARWRTLKGEQVRDCSRPAAVAPTR